MTNKTIFLLGNGIRNNPQLIEYVKSLNTPIVLTWMSRDLLDENDVRYIGCCGTMGSRSANILIQKADLIYIMGARLDDDTVAFRLDNFGKNAKKIVYDVDQAELDKLPNNSQWKKIKIDLNKIDSINYTEEPNLNWLYWCKALYTSFLYESDNKENTKFVDVNSFVNLMSDICTENDVIALGSSSTAPVSFLQNFKVKRGQRITGCSTIGSMGLCIGMSIGACIGSGNKRTICPTGDGSFLMQSQELEVVRRLNLPIKYFIYNNNGYSAIRSMQLNRFGTDHKVGCDPESGLTLPSIRKLANVYDIDYVRIHTLNDFTTKSIKHHMDTNKPSIIELNIDPNHIQFPKVGTSLINGKFITDDISDMTPKLSKKELENILSYEIP